MASNAQGSESSPATRFTAEANRRALEELPVEDARDFEDARRGFVAPPLEPTVIGEEGKVVWDASPYAFLEAHDPAADGLDPDRVPATVHPALWRQARLNSIAGLFEVTDGVYQVRGLDLSNMTLIEGERGVIVVDPLASMECAARALELYRAHRGEREVTAVLYTHSHVDHFGGVKGVVDVERVEAGEVDVWAPEHFMEHAVSENVLAGNVMGRRSMMMFGNALERGVAGQLDCGIGKTVSDGTVTLIAPTRDVTETGQRAEVDGVELVFQMVPETEAPAELNFMLPERHALCVAEIASHSLHNVLTPRGALVRDALRWAKALGETLDLFGEEAEVMFHGHNWPTWGRERIVRMLGEQRDLYRAIHDQTLRMANAGMTGEEIAEAIELPESLTRSWACRGLYGTVSHNARAVYQRYIGVFDGNPARLDPLPPGEAGSRYVELAGGAETLVEKARQAFERGEYRWTAELTSHLVFAETENAEARELEARALEQLGFQAESGVWRNIYLSGAAELREGVTKVRDTVAAGRDVARSLTVEMAFDAMGSRLNAGRAADRRIVVNWHFKDLGERWALTIENGALSHRQGAPAADADAELTLTRAAFDALLIDGPQGLAHITPGDLDVSGDGEKLIELMSLFDQPDPAFGVAAP